MSEFRERLAEVVASGFSPREIARHCEVMLSTVQRWIDGSTQPPESGEEYFLRKLKELRTSTPPGV